MHSPGGRGSAGGGRRQEERKVRRSFQSKGFLNERPPKFSASHPAGDHLGLYSRVFLVFADEKTIGGIEAARARRGRAGRGKGISAEAPGSNDRRAEQLYGASSLSRKRIKPGRERKPGAAGAPGLYDYFYSFLNWHRRCSGAPPRLSAAERIRIYQTIRDFEASGKGAR